jgi:rare lipoprotein A
MRRLITTSLILLVGLCANAQDKKSEGIVDHLKSIKDNITNGIASFYHDKFEGRKTATGEVFDNDKFTAASNKLKLGTYVKVTNLSNGEVVYVRINDRMAKSNTRVIDLASVAAKKLHFHEKGVAKVKVEAVSDEEGRIGILAQNGYAPATTSNQL